MNVTTFVYDLNHILTRSVSPMTLLRYENLRVVTTTPIKMVNTVLPLTPVSSLTVKATQKLNQFIPCPVVLSEFNAARQISLFRSLKEDQFSGRLLFKSSQGQESIFYLFLGRIVFATGGEHPMRRWLRLLSQYCPEIANNWKTIEKDLSTLISQKPEINWQYQLLSLWVKQQKINREQLIGIIRGILNETLFDLNQSGEITYQIEPDKTNYTPLFLVNVEEVIVEVWKLWQGWQSAGFSQYSLNMAPVIKKMAQLEAQTSPVTCQILKERLNGQTSLRDLATQLHQDVIQLIRSLKLYMKWGLVDLIEISDLPAPFAESSLLTSGNNPLIAYVDNSLAMCQWMKQVLTQAGYQFLAIQDQKQVIPLCLEQKPDVILMNTLVPTALEYAICHELRQVPLFRHTPILMMMQEANLIDKIRAKMAGFSEVLGKLNQPEPVINTIAKCLQQASAA